MQRTHSLEEWRLVGFLGCGWFSHGREYTELDGPWNRNRNGMCRNCSVGMEIATLMVYMGWPSQTCGVHSTSSFLRRHIGGPGESSGAGGRRSPSTARSGMTALGLGLRPTAVS